MNQKIKVYLGLKMGISTNGHCNRERHDHPLGFGGPYFVFRQTREYMPVAEESS